MWPLERSEVTLRRREWILLGLFLAGMLAAGFLGRRAAPDATLQDPRASTYLTGPAGAGALAETLEALGIEVERRRLPLFGVAGDLDERGGRTSLAVLEPAYDMTAEEAREVAEYVRAGGTVVLAGRTGAERELGVSVVWVQDLGSGDDTAAVSPPEGIGSVPGVWSVLGRTRWAGSRLALSPIRVDTLLEAMNRRAVAWRMEFRGGGRALVIAESDWIRNRAMRETDVGALVIPWLLSLGVERLVVDEYHQGFGRSGAIVGAAWRWLRGGPAGWAMLQLGFAALVTLAAMSVRFGPAIHAVSRRRRSPIEHLDALAAGLERAGGHQTAVALLGRGLSRRLRRTGTVTPRAAWSRDRERWLAALARGSDDPAARAAVKRLGWLLRETGASAEHVLRTAQAVEDVWEALKRPSGRAPS
jgi:hypothetical protein